jgi:TonB family protein
VPKGQNIGGFYFDPQGADFTLWIQHLKDDVYRNWILPQTALLGSRGHVNFEFVIEEDGTMSSLRMLKSSGTDSLDHAARRALADSRCLRLPRDYGPRRLTLQVTFYYNESPPKTWSLTLLSRAGVRIECSSEQDGTRE